MQVNYVVRIRETAEEELASLCVVAGDRRWVPLGEAAAMALTGLARKVLRRAELLPAHEARDRRATAGVVAGR
jgi:hypothetical protein